MKVTIQESDLLAELASELWDLEEPDFPQFATLELPPSIEKALINVLCNAVTTTPTDRFPMPYRSMVQRVRTDEILHLLIDTPWKSIHVVDTLGTIVLTY